MKPHEKRAAAAAKKAEADKIFQDVLAANREATTEEEKRHDSLLTEAEGLLNSAIAEEKREQRVNALEASLDANPGRRSAPTGPHNDPSNTHNGRHGYSVLRALRAMDPMNKHDRLDGIELETHQELIKRRNGMELNRKPDGVCIPWDLEIDTRASAAYSGRTGTERRTATLTLSTGAGAIQNYTFPTMIEYLRALSLFNRLGAKIMSDMQGNFVLPRQTGTVTFQVINSESSTVTASNATVNGVDFSPRTMIGQTVYSRSFLKQTAIDAEMFAREDMALAEALALDYIGFNGTGSGANPYGLLYNTNITVISSGTNGGAPTWQLVSQLERAVESANALNGTLAYVTSPQGKHTLKTTVKDSNTAAKYLWNEDLNTVNGYPAWSSNQLPNNLSKGSSGTVLSPLLFGNFSDAVFAFWGGMDTIVNPFSGSASGAVELTMMQDFDFHARHDLSFAALLDMIVQ